jgi:bacterioferritin (cytochrome b1)
MALSEDWSEWWRRFLDLSQDNSRQAVDILRQRYVEEMHQRDRLKQHAEKMHYPQFRRKLFQMASEKNEHAERIAQKILALGGKLPSVPELRSTDENSWQQLMMALEEENRSADHLAEQLRGIEPDHSDVTKLLQQISEEQKKHRADIRHMLMRSDPFAFSLA